MIVLQKAADRVILFSGYTRLIVFLICGVLAAFGQAPYFFIPACFVSFTLLVWLMDGVCAAHSIRFFMRLLFLFLFGFCFGLGYLFTGLILGSVNGNLAQKIMGLFEIFPLWDILFASLFFGLATLISGAFWNNGAGRITCLALAFGFSEYLRSFLCPDVSWSMIGSSIMPIPFFMQSVQIIGVPGMNMLAVLLFSIPALFAFQSHRKIGGAFFVLILFAHAGFGYFSLFSGVEKVSSTPSSFVVRVVQPAFELNFQKRSDAYQKELELLLHLSKNKDEEKKKPDLIIWPGILSSSPDKKSETLMAAQEVLEEGGVLLTEFEKEEENASYSYKSLVLIDREGKIIDSVDKNYFPFLKRKDVFKNFFSGIIKEKSLSVFFGLERHPFHFLTLPKGMKVFGAIGSEPILKDNGVHNFNAFMVNFPFQLKDESFAVFQKLHQAQISAVETGMFLIKSGNVGVSAVIDPRGYIVALASIKKQHVIDVDLATYLKQKSQYPFDSLRKNVTIVLFLFLLIATSYFIISARWS